MVHVDIVQDASVEKNVPTVQLYPIQHLDDLEYFPGDFVVSNTGTISFNFSTIRFIKVSIYLSISRLSSKGSSRTPSTKVIKVWAMLILCQIGER